VTEQQKGLKGLKPHAEATLFDDWRVTPDLKERLQRRIRIAEKSQAPARRRGWVWVGGLATAAVFVLAVGMMDLSSQPRSRAEEQGMMAARGEAGPATPPPGGAEYTRSAPTPQSAMNMKSTSPMTVQLYDKSGDSYTQNRGMTATESDVTFKATVTDGNGNAVPAPVPGMEAMPGRKIILNAEYQFRVTDAAKSMQQLQDLANASGGYMVNATLNKSEDGSFQGAATLRIPSARYGGVIQSIRQVGEIRQERQWSQDVTEQFMDLEVRIRIQTEYEVKLQELADKAATFDDWMRLTQQINANRADIERMQGSLKLMANQVDYSTINVGLFQPAPEAAAKPKPEPEKGLWAQMAWSFTESLRVMGNLGKNLLVSVATAAPFALALVLGLGALLLGLRLRRRSEPK
jgi:hypothetical protein